MSQITRRTLIGGVGAASVASVAPSAVAGGARPDPSAVSDWIARNASPLTGVSPTLPDDDLRSLVPLVRHAAVVGLGEAAHTTSTLFDLKFRLARLLIERTGARTIAWEEAWGSGLLIDRYITRGIGNPREIVGQAAYNLQVRGLLRLMEWARSFNESRRPHDQVRFLGADVVQLRQVQFDELTAYVADRSPGNLPVVRKMLAELSIREHPGSHIGWFRELSWAEQLRILNTARDLVRTIRPVIAGDRSQRGFEAQLHTLTILGFYEAYSRKGEPADKRDEWINTVLRLWQARHRRQIAYSAANAHVTTVPRQTVSFPDLTPPETWVTERRLVGGLLRRRLGRHYVSLGTSFDHGTLLAGWQTGDVRPYDVPPPTPAAVDHVLGSTPTADYVLDLHSRRPAHVRRWLNSTGRQRIYGGAFYDATIDSSYYHQAQGWGCGYDALLHVGEIAAAQPVGARE